MDPFVMPFGLDAPGARSKRRKRVTAHPTRM